MPKLWDESIEAHRQQVRDAILDAVAALVGEGGVRSVTMSQLAQRAGIGRATLYKYFSDIETVLLAWHAREIAVHLRQLHDVRGRTADPVRRLEAVLETYARIVRQIRTSHDVDLVAFLHRDRQVPHAQAHVRELLRGLITDAAATGHIRDDVSADELAGYCEHALGFAADLSTQAAVRRLVRVTMTGLQPPSARGGADPAA